MGAFPRLGDRTGGGACVIELNHTIVPSLDRVASARFFADIFDLDVEDARGHFSVVRVNDALTLDFANSTGFGSHHLAFKVSKAEFEKMFARIQDRGIAFGSGPRSDNDMKINHRGGGRGIYFKDPNGHLLELLTAG